MKKALTINRSIAAGITAILLLAGLSLHSFSQTHVTGHIFAEVVELTVAESNATAYVSLDANAVAAGFDLGEISFKGKAHTAYDLNVTSSALVGSNGDEAAFSAQPEHFNSTLDASGNQVIRLTGSADSDLTTSPERLYAGNYQVIFSYN